MYTIYGYYYIFYAFGNKYPDGSIDYFKVEWRCISRDEGCYIKSPI